MNWNNLEAALNEYGQYLQQMYLSNAPQATGDLARSAKYEIRKGDNYIEVGLNLLPYWKWVEKGRKPGKMPPIDAILQWVKVKPIIPRENNGVIPTEKQLAYLIARKIGRDGTDPQNIFNESNQSAKDRFINKILEAIKKDMGTELGQAFVALHKY